MEWNQAKDAVLVGLLGAIGTIISISAVFLLGEFRKMRLSVEKLNINVAVILARMSNHEDRIEKLEAKNQ